MKLSILPLLGAVVAGLVGLVAGEGTLTAGLNPIHFPLGGDIKAGKTITITWTPTSKGTISLILIKGPQVNMVPVDTIAASIKNTGSFTYTVPETLEGKGTMDKIEHYGLKIVDDSTGNFQFSPPFDIVNPNFKTATSSATSSASEKSSATSSATSSASSISSSSASTTSASATSTASTSATITATATPTASKNEPEKKYGPFTTLSLVGVAVGGAAVLVGACACLLFCLRTRKNRKHQRLRGEGLERNASLHSQRASMAYGHGQGHRELDEDDFGLPPNKGSYAMTNVQERPGYEPYRGAAGGPPGQVRFHDDDSDDGHPRHGRPGQFHDGR